jgi:hypothetical protein
MGLVNGRKILCEQKHVVASKILSFFGKISSVSKFCQNGSKKTKSEGKRFTILHAGCRFGFLGRMCMILYSPPKLLRAHKLLGV